MKGKKWLFRSVMGFYMILFLYLTFQHFQWNRLANVARDLATSPVLVLAMFIIYGCSFLLRAYSWRLYLNNRVSFRDCINALWYSLLVNHIMPVKVGDVVRIGFLYARQNRYSVAEIAHSVIAMRVLDMATLILFSSIGLYVVTDSLALSSTALLLVTLGVTGVVVAFVLYRFRPKMIQKHLQLLRTAFQSPYRFFIVLAILLSWVLEAIVVYSIATLFITPLSLWQSIWVNSMTVGGQVFQFLPGGIATYEATMAFALTPFHFSVSDAFHLALLTHLFKFGFSYIIGIYVFIISPIKKADVTHWMKYRLEGSKK